MAQPEIGQTGIADPIRGQIIKHDNGKITPPHNILQTVGACRQMYYAWRLEHVKRIQLQAQIEGLIAGNPPYDPEELEKDGLGHIANFNDLQPRSWFERVANSFWALDNQAETIATFNLRYNNPEAKRFAEILGTHFTWVVKKWKSYPVMMGTLSSQLIKFGVSPIVWSDERDWRWRVIELSRFFVPDQALCDIEQLPGVAVESIYNVQYLFGVYNEFKDDPEGSPWDLDELANLLIHFANTNLKSNTDMVWDMMELQRRYQNGDLSLQTVFGDGVRLVSLFYQEYDGKISHYMFHRVWDSGKLLYFVDRQYDQLCDALQIFTASPGEFNIHSNRGIGHKIFSASQAIMQLNCNLVDGARNSTTPLIKGSPLVGKEFEQVRLYPGVPTNIGAAEFVQNTMGANLTNLIEVSQFLTKTIQFNLANSGDDPGIPDAGQGSISAPQAKMKATREFGILKQNVNHYYVQKDNMVETMVYRMLQSKKGYPGYEYAEEWIRRCVQDGVPEEIFTEARAAKGKYLSRTGAIEARATRVAGDGSQLARIMSAEQSAAIAGGFGPKEARALKREFIMAIWGPEFLSTFDQDSDTADEQAGGASLAAVENAIMLDGKSAVFSLDNEHKSHTATHMALGVDTMQKTIKQEMTAIEADKIFTPLIPHMVQHLQALQRDQMFSRDFLAKMEKPWKQLQEYALLTRKKAIQEFQTQQRNQQKAQEQQQQVLSDIQLKQMKTEADIAIADKKVNAQIERGAEANDNRANIMREKVQRDAENKRLQIRLEADAKKTGTTNPKEAIDELTGTTPSPYDIEDINEGELI